MKRWSLRTRLTVLYGGLFLIAGAVLLTVLYIVVRARLDDQLSNEANTRVAKLRQQAAANGSSTVTLPGGGTASIDDIARQVNAEQQAIRNAALNSLLAQGGIAVGVIVVVAGGAGWLLAARALRPLHTITATAERIAGSRAAERDLRERIALSGRDDDINRLAGSFDAMLDSLEQTFDSQRRFVANASHELRTPLAVERALIELEISKPAAAPDTVHLGSSLLRMNERHTRLIDGLLLLADSENEIEQPAATDLADIARHVLATTDLVADVADVTVQADLDPAPVTGDPVLLEQLVRNLVENAHRHNIDGGWLRLTTGTRDGHGVLQVSNSGKVISPHEIDGLFEPFRRHPGDERAAKRGFGLGLSIVRAITSTHTGTAALQARDEGGLTVTVTIPERPLD